MSDPLSQGSQNSGISTKASFSTKSSFVSSKRMNPLRMSTTAGAAANMLIANINSNMKDHHHTETAKAVSRATDSPKSKPVTAYTEELGDKSDTEEATPVVAKKFNTQLFKKNIVGDLFGTSTGESLAGLLYRSRIVEKDVKKQTEDKSVEKSDLLNADSLVEDDDGDNDSENETKTLQTMNPKQQLAVTIKNWSVFPENDQHLIKEGAIYALIALAHVDDITIRRCCASAFYYLSTRAGNREELLSMGITNGVTSLAIPLGAHLSALMGRKWKIAKLCTMTLCNLSMQAEGEITMANEYAIMALMVLVGINGHALLPICAQTMYNMTSCMNPFKGVERIIKLLLNTSLSGHDHSEILVKVLVNCSRYSWLRLRIIEEGGISQMHSIVTTLSMRENKMEMATYVLTALRSLSESSGCRPDMLQKNSVELLSHLLPLCLDDERCRLLTMKIIHNFVHPPTTISNHAFEIAVQMTSIVSIRATDIPTVQYCSAAFNLFAKENMRGIRPLAVLVINSMNKMLQSTDSLTQFFAISSAGNLFFGNLCDDPAKIEQLVKFFVLNGEGIRDPSAKQALALALAKLSQDSSYMDIIDRLGLLDQVLKLLTNLREVHRDSLLLQESCCIAICRIALRLGQGMSDAERNTVTSTLFSLLKVNDRNVLSSAISSIRALGVSNLCPDEFLKDEHFLSQIAEIILRFKWDTELGRYGCAVLAVFSYDTAAHDRLAEKDIMQVLFSNINSEDAITRELVANSLCNLSVHPKACQTMIDMNVVEVLGQLSCSTSETILDLCAKSLCNLTCNAELHKKMIANNVLEIIIMIALVRTVSSQTKCTCAKALLNLVSDENLPSITESGAIRVFASLSTSPFGPVQAVCSKGFHLLTLNEMRRKELVKNRTVVQSLFHMIKSSTSTSSRVKVRMGISVVNLLSCSITNREAIQAGALACLKIIATMDFEELRDAVARVILRMAADRSMHSVLFTEPIVPVLLLIIQRHQQPATFELAVRGLRSLASIESFRKIFIRDQGLDALIGAVFSGKVVRRVICQEICRAWTNLSYLYDQCEGMIRSGSLALALQIMQRSRLAKSADTKMLMLVLIRNISESSMAREHILLQGIFASMVQMVLDDFENHTHDTSADDDARTCLASIGYAAVVRIMHNLCLVPKLHEHLIVQGIMTAIQRIVFPLDIVVNASQPGADAPVGQHRTFPATGSGISSSFRHTLTNSGTNSPATMSSPRSGTFVFTSGQASSNVAPLSPASSKRQQTTNIPKSAPASGRRLYFTCKEVEHLSMILCILSSSSSCHESMVAGQVMEIFRALLYSNISATSKCEVATALAQIAQSRTCREMLVNQSAVELLIALSITSDSTTQSQCAMALGYLSEITKVSKGVVASMLLLGLSMDDGSLADRDDVSVSSLQSRKTVDETTPSIPPQSASGTTKPPPLLSASTDSVAILANAIAPDNQKITTLRNLLRDMLPDRIRFDSYVDALRVGNHENLITNEFHPKVTMRSATDGSSAAGAGAGAGSTGVKSHKASMRLSTGANLVLVNGTADPSVVAAIQAHPSMDALINGNYTRLAVADSHQHLLAYEEQSLLKSLNDPQYYFETPQSQDAYAPEAGGLSRKLTVQLALPGIPTDRDLEPGNRHKDLHAVPVDQNPLPKDTRVPVAADHHRPVGEYTFSAATSATEGDEPTSQTEEEEIPSVAAAAKALSLAAPNGGKKKTRHGMVVSHARTLGLGSPARPRGLGTGELDPRSPLLKANPQGMFIPSNKPAPPLQQVVAPVARQHSASSGQSGHRSGGGGGVPLKRLDSRSGMTSSANSLDGEEEKEGFGGRFSAGFGIGDEDDAVTGDELQQERLHNEQERAMHDSFRMQVKGRLSRGGTDERTMPKLGRMGSTRSMPRDDTDEDSPNRPRRITNSRGSFSSIS